MPITVEQALSIGGLKECRLLAGSNGLTRHVHHVNSMEIPNIGPWLTYGELLVTTGYAIKDSSDELVDLIRELHRANAVGLAIKTRFIGSIPEAAVHEADELSIVLLEVPSDMPFVNIITPLVKAIVDDQNSRLEYSETIHTKFIELEVNGGGFTGIADMLCSLLNLPVAVAGLNFDIHALQSPAQFPDGLERLKDFITHHCIDPGELLLQPGEALHIPDNSHKGYEYIIRRIHIKSRLQGYLMLYSTSEPLPDMSDVILDHAVTTIALEFSKNRALREQAVLMGNHFFLDILSGNIKNEEECKQRASRLNWPSPPFRLLVFDVEHFSEVIRDKTEEEIQELKDQTYFIINTHLRRMNLKAAVVMKSDSFTCLLPSFCRTEALADIVAAICKEVRRHLHFTLTAGISSLADSFEDLKEAYLEARDAILIARLSLDENNLVFIESARMEQSFVKISDNPYIQKYVKKVITDLIEYDTQNNTNLFETLKVFIDCMGIKTKAAETLYLHRNTLSHRIKKIEKITGYNLSRTNDLFSLGIALKLYPYIQGAS